MHSGSGYVGKRVVRVGLVQGGVDLEFEAMGTDSYVAAEAVAGVHVVVDHADAVVAEGRGWMTGPRKEHTQMDEFQYANENVWVVYVVAYVVAYVANVANESAHKPGSSRARERNRKRLDNCRRGEERVSSPASNYLTYPVRIRSAH
jgi:hypothetical protein